VVLGTVGVARDGESFIPWKPGNPLKMPDNCERVEPPTLVVAADAVGVPETRESVIPWKPGKPFKMPHNCARLACRMAMPDTRHRSFIICCDLLCLSLKDGLDM
jgi:hypothetical protein